MKQMIAILLILTLSIAGPSPSLGHDARSESAGSGTRGIRITAKIPDTSPSDLVKPSYPPDVHVRGKVVVGVKIDEAGNVASTRAISGQALLRPLALDAARKSKFARN